MRDKEEKFYLDLKVLTVVKSDDLVFNFCQAFISEAKSGGDFLINPRWTGIVAGQSGFLLDSGVEGVPNKACFMAVNNKIVPLVVQNIWNGPSRCTELIGMAPLVLKIKKLVFLFQIMFFCNLFCYFVLRYNTKILMRKTNLFK